MLDIQYNQEAEFQILREEAEELGIEKGIEKRNLEIVKNGLANNIPVDIIMTLTGLDDHCIASLSERI